MVLFLFANHERADRLGYLIIARIPALAIQFVGLQRPNGIGAGFDPFYGLFFVVNQILRNRFQLREFAVFHVWLAVILVEHLQIFTASDSKHYAPHSYFRRQES